MNVSVSQSCSGSQHTSVAVCFTDRQHSTTRGRLVKGSPLYREVKKKNRHFKQILLFRLSDRSFIKQNYRKLSHSFYTRKRGSPVALLLAAHLLYVLISTQPTLYDPTYRNNFYCSVYDQKTHRRTECIGRNIH